MQGAIFSKVSKRKVNKKGKNYKYVKFKKLITKN
jgi:hypothetical protein